MMTLLTVEAAVVTTLNCTDANGRYEYTKEVHAYGRSPKGQASSKQLATRETLRERGEERPITVKETYIKGKAMSEGPELELKMIQVIRDQQRSEKRFRDAVISLETAWSITHLDLIMICQEVQSMRQPM